MFVKYLAHIFFAAILLLNSFFQFPAQAELEKLNGLAEHYSYHKALANGGAFHFWQFLVDHYLPQSRHDHDPQTHDGQLPFRYSATGASLYLVPPQPEMSVKASPVVEDHPFVQHHYTFMHTDAHFQPPKNLNL